MGKLFGTDGIRGIVNDDLTVDLALKIGASVTKVLKKNLNKKELKFVIGGDTRISREMLSSSVSAGVLSEGGSVIDVGVMPTPAISYLTKLLNCDGAFIISASHNPSKYNGIKVLDNFGYKLTEDMESEVEELLLQDKFEYNKEVNNCGSITKLDNPEELYVDYLLTTIDKISNMKILVDAANGASYKTSEMLFSKLGIDYKIINNTPDGLNINENAGSTHIDNLVEIVKSEHYDVGIAYDGDADRCIMVDDLGNVIDGDYILAICSSYLKENDRLKNNTLVGTVMSNLGLVKYSEENGINFEATKVGDKYVLECMLKNDYILGGEQSGHIIFKEFANTGDGELTSLQVLNVISKKNKSLSELKNVMKSYPQVMINVEVSKEGKDTFKENENINNMINDITDKLHGDGRVLVRASGTENLIRVMLEGSDLYLINNYCKTLADFIKNELK